MLLIKTGKKYKAKYTTRCCSVNFALLNCHTIGEYGKNPKGIYYYKSGPSDHLSEPTMLTDKVRVVCMAATLLLAALPILSAAAAPRVEGTTIYLPEDGWYQVQRADNFASICNGELTCRVDPGIYIVINHTTGERFESVEVRDESSQSDGVTVSGNQISWSGDDWYQVQDSTSFATLCEGGNECVVPDGTYIVINHNTGKRYESIVVPDGDTPNPPAISVVGNQISLPDDGWYQVQNATTFESFCEGQLSCTVPAGEYIVINHTTGTRHEGIVVSGSMADSFFNESTYLGILQNVVTVLNAESLNNDRIVADELAKDLLVMGDRVMDGGAPDAGLSLVLLTTDSPSLTVQDYACGGGGALSLPLYDFGSAPVTRREYSFDQCAYNSAEYDGQYTFTQSRRSPVVSTFSELSVQTGNGDRFMINGLWDDSTPANPFGFELLTWADTTYIKETENGVMTVNGLNRFSEAYETQLSTNRVSGYVQLQDGSIGYASLITQRANLEASFHVIADWTEQQDIRVETNLAFNGTYFDWASFAPDADVQVPDYPVSDLGSPLTLFSTPDFNSANAVIVENLPRRSVQWETGEIRLTAIDGSSVVMQPSSTDGSLVDIFLSGSTEAVSSTWANGLQITCPDVFLDECR